MQLTEFVHLVGSGQSGFSLTDPLDCHVYLLDGGSELALIDTGVGRDVPAIAAQIKAAGFDPRDISKIFVTHLHLDHAGGAAELQQLCGAEIIASQDVAGWLETGDEEAASLVAARQTGMYPLENRLRPVASATAAADGDVSNVGSLTVTVLKADGHSRGHLAFLIDDCANREDGAIREKAALIAKTARTVLSSAAMPSSLADVSCSRTSGIVRLKSPSPP